MSLERDTNGSDSNEVEYSPERDWERQAEKYISLGFHKELGFSEAEYLMSLPTFDIPQLSFEGRLGIQFLVETRIPINKMIDLAQGYQLNEEYSDWEGDEFKYKTPDKPYSLWVSDGSSGLRRSVVDARNRLLPDERGGTVFDGVALFIQSPEVFRKFALWLPGSQAEGDKIPILMRWGREHRLHLDNTNIPKDSSKGSAFFGSLICARHGKMG